METPICDFVKAYSEKNALRLHMPGHKGAGFLGVEALDITEIKGADSLYEALGIIAESEKNASRIFGCPTYYSTEGSSQCIRAMLYLALLHAKKQGKKPLIAAARNVHKTFLSAAALLDLDVLWICPEKEESYLSCSFRPEYLENVLADAEELPAAVYLTSPDYLGLMADITGIANVCRRHGILLLVDNAHGAYLRLLEGSLHPMDLGADMCCASAHKTLPVLTGGAYLHLSPALPEHVTSQAKNALALFGSTSPSYLIMQSLDAANRYMCGCPESVQHFVDKTDALKTRLEKHGFSLYGNEPLKLSISAKPYGYTGRGLDELLLRQNIVSEFADPDYIVFMLTPYIGDEGLHRLEKALTGIEKKSPIVTQAPRFHKCEKRMSIRDASLSVSEVIPCCQAEGRILAAASVSCPPAVPILVCGEQIDKTAIECFEYYGIENCTVITE